MGCSLLSYLDLFEYVIYPRELTIGIQDVMLTLVMKVMHIRNQQQTLEKRV